MAESETIQEVLVEHNRYQDSMVHAFETHLRQIVLRAQARVIAALQKKLALEGDAIEATAANQRALRSIGPMFMDAMREEGYDRLVNAFVGEFKGTLPYLDKTFDLLGLGDEWRDKGFTAAELNLMASAQLNAATSIDAAIQSASGLAMTRGLFGVGGLKFGSLTKVLTERFETSIAQARTLADTSMTTFYRQAADLGYQKIEADLPAQEIRYKYYGPDDKLTRPFCDHLIKLAKPYTRDEIGRMNNGQLPNVFLTGGGWNCRHQWILDTAAVQERVVAAADVIRSASADIEKAVRVATGAIDKVHRLPASLGKVEVVSDAKMEEGGKFQWDIATGKPLPIRLNPKSDHAELTALLETGHLIDFDAIGKGGRFASIDEPALEGWRKAIDATRAVQKLEDQRAAGYIPFRARDGRVRDVFVRERTRYLLQPYELFSRSYAQFIAGESGNATLLRQIDGFRSPENPSSIVPTYWDDDDFEGVAEAFRKLILDLGWQNKPNK